ncbi:hypothetical protein ACT048_12300 [Ectopseudomonas khazarica]|uniref:hypothetical protein n=1 Tax=Ectopseudomonas khazarica TaxID=2502979 RepID=UPI0040337068
MSDSPDSQLSPLSKWSSSGTRILQAEAIERFNLNHRLERYGSQYSQSENNTKIHIIEGDLRIDDNLLLDWEAFDSHGLVVTGNLTVTGSIINANSNGGPFLLVAGQTRAHAIIGGGAELVFEGNAQVADIVIGHYNDGILTFQADLTVPVVVTMDHYLYIRGNLDGRWFDVFNDGDEWSSFLDMQQPKMAIMNEDDWIGLNDVLIPLVKAGRSVLRADLPPQEIRNKFKQPSYFYSPVPKDGLK